MSLSAAAQRIIQVCARSQTVRGVVVEKEAPSLAAAGQNPRSGAETET